MDRLTAHLDRGWELVTKGDTRRAFIAARRALELNEESPEAHNLMGYIHALDGDLEEALSCYRRAMDLDEYYLDPILNAADLLVHPDSDPAEAATLCDKAMEISLTDEERLDAALLLVEALLNMDKVDEARQKLTALQPQAPLRPPYETLLGRALYEVGLLEEAEVHLRQAVTSEPRSADAWYYLALMAREQGSRVEAVRCFAKVHELEKEAPLPPWASRVPPLATVISKAIERLNPELRGLLDGTEILVEDRPSMEQVNLETDPRQAVALRGVDPMAGRFQTLIVFRCNLLRCGTTLVNLAEDLSVMIGREANPFKADD
ncbi:MAG: tetratricopeptide repeat protein [Myxococcota bacterium]|jgi:tetratricopeptide (TPR) repeat protein|nr:tetratricopeptide repeat protein [Myxococcota bacterium]